MKVIIKTKRGRVIATYNCNNSHIINLDIELRKIYPKPEFRIAYVLEG